MVALTVAFHIIFAPYPKGLPFAIFLILLVVGIHSIVRMMGVLQNKWTYVFLIPAALAAAAQALYSSHTTIAISYLIAVISLIFFAYWITTPRVAFGNLQSLWPRALAGETVGLFRWLDKFFLGLKTGRQGSHALIGGIIAVPFLVVIGILFASADPLFRKFALQIFDVKNANELVVNIIRDVVFAFFLLCVVWNIYTRAVEARAPKFTERVRDLQAMVITTLLALLNLLFIIFLGFQIAYFFGGQDFIVHQGLTYAEYARSGFFELLAVSGIVFMLSWAIYAFVGMREKWIKVSSVLLILQTGVVVTSAVKRLLLYIDAYGLSLSRFWAMTIILIIALILAVIAIAILISLRYQTVVKYAFLGILIVFSGILLVNIEGVVAGHNINRFLYGNQPLDFGYLDGLSGDVVPQMVRLYHAPWPEGRDIKNESLWYGRPGDDVEVQFGDKESMLVALHGIREEIGQEIARDWRHFTFSDYFALRAASSIPAPSGEGLKALWYARMRERRQTSPTVPVSKNYTFPKVFVGDISLNNEKLTSLDGIVLPEDMTGNLNLSSNELTSLKGLPKRLKGTLDVSHNRLTALGDLPGGLIALNASNNMLTSLQGMPKEMRGWVNLGDNKLDSLDGMPTTMRGSIALQNNPLTSLEQISRSAWDIQIQNIPAKTFPVGVKVNRIYVAPHQTDLIADLQKKGYRIFVSK